LSRKNKQKIAYVSSHGSQSPPIYVMFSGIDPFDAEKGFEDMNWNLDFFSKN